MKLKLPLLCEVIFRFNLPKLNDELEFARLLDDFTTHLEKNHSHLYEHVFSPDYNFKTGECYLVTFRPMSDYIRQKFVSEIKNYFKISKVSIDSWEKYED